MRNEASLGEGGSVRFEELLGLRVGNEELLLTQSLGNEELLGKSLDLDKDP